MSFPIIEEDTTFDNIVNGLRRGVVIILDFDSNSKIYYDKTTSMYIYTFRDLSENTLVIKKFKWLRNLMTYALLVGKYYVELG